MYTISKISINDCYEYRTGCRKWFTSEHRGVNNEDLFAGTFPVK